MSDFHCDGPVLINVTLGAGECTVRAADRDTAAVSVTAYKNDAKSTETAENTKVDFQNGRLTVQVPEAVTGWLLGRRSGAVNIDIEVPDGSSANVKSTSAAIACRGELAVVSATTASGAITVEKAAEVNLNTASGDTHVIECTGAVRGNTVSADLQLDYVSGEINAKSVSGDVRVGYAGCGVQGNTVSGDFTIRSIREGSTRIRSVSGAVSVGVAQGTGVWMDLNSASGTTSSDLAVGDMPSSAGANAELYVNTVSGNIDLFRSQPA